MVRVALLAAVSWIWMAADVLGDDLSPSRVTSQGCAEMKVLAGQQDTDLARERDRIRALDKTRDGALAGARASYEDARAETIKANEDELLLERWRRANPTKTQYPARLQDVPPPIDGRDLAKLPTSAAVKSQLESLAAQRDFAATRAVTLSAELAQTTASLETCVDQTAAPSRPGEALPTESAAGNVAAPPRNAPTVMLGSLPGSYLGSFVDKGIASADREKCNYVNAKDIQLTVAEDGSLSWLGRTFSMVSGCSHATSTGCLNRGVGTAAAGTERGTYLLNTAWIDKSYIPRLPQFALYKCRGIPGNIAVDMSSGARPIGDCVRMGSMNEPMEIKAGGLGCAYSEDWHGLISQTVKPRSDGSFSLTINNNDLLLRRATVGASASSDACASALSSMVTPICTTHQPGDWKCNLPGCNQVSLSGVRIGTTNTDPCGWARALSSELHFVGTSSRKQKGCVDTMRKKLDAEHSACACLHPEPAGWRRTMICPSVGRSRDNPYAGMFSTPGSGDCVLLEAPAYPWPPTRKH